MSHVTSRSCDGMWNMKHEEWCHKWCHMEKGYKHGKSYLNQGLRYIFRIIKAWRPCEWRKGINVIENKRIMRIKKRYSWIYLTRKWIPYRRSAARSSKCSESWMRGRARSRRQPGRSTQHASGTIDPGVGGWGSWMQRWQEPEQLVVLKMRGSVSNCVINRG